MDKDSDDELFGNTEENESHNNTKEIKEMAYDD